MIDFSVSVEMELKRGSEESSDVKGEIFFLWVGVIDLIN